VIGQRHLSDDRLYECFVAAQTGDALDPRAAEHLGDCGACHARYADVASVMTTLRADADAEVDALYSADALRTQQSQIARRLEHLGHAARVISFPRHTVSGSMAGHASRITPRWLAAAAAAGLFVGVGLGSFVHAPAFSRARRAQVPITAPATTSEPRAAAPVGAPEPVPTSAPATADADDASDKFMEELEFALSRPRTSELLAFDELTPHVREISLSTRLQ
jgi:hypothetical protein